MNIGILTRESKTKDGVIINGIPYTYLNVIKDYGYPIIINSTLDINVSKDNLLFQMNQCDCFILPGGDKISKVDLFVIDYCYKHNIPLLGICLGMQEIAYYFGKANIVPIGNNIHFDMKEKYLHSISLNNNSYLYKVLCKKKIDVNSRHKYKILENENYSIEATSKDIIEAIKVKGTNFILGLQFHPEIMYEYDENAKKIFKHFFKQSIIRTKKG